MPSVIFMQGIQGCGKSSFSRKWQLRKPLTRTIINWDSYRMGHGIYGNFSHESIVKKESVAALKEAMDKKLDIIIDNMNLSESSRAPFIKEIEKYNKVNSADPYIVEFKLINTPLDECIRRDALRQNPIGAFVIRSTYSRYKKYLEEFPLDTVAPIKRSNRKAVIFDLDGTLCINNSGRPWYGEGSEVGMQDDTPNQEIVSKLKEYLNNPLYRVFIVTGRSGSVEVKAATELWFTNNNIDPQELSITFRNPSDYASGYTYKKEVIDNIASEYDIEAIYEDDERMLKLEYNVVLVNGEKG